MVKDNKDTKTIASVERAIEILECIAKSGKAMGVTEISNALGYGVSSTYHQLNTLKKYNMLNQDKETKKFNLGMKLWQLGTLVSQQNDIFNMLDSFLKKVRDLTGESANLSILDNDKILYISQYQSERMVRSFTQAGVTAPLHCTGAGKMLLAHQSDPIKMDIIDNLELDRFTSNTITTKKELLKELEQIKKQGYGEDKEEREYGVSCISGPVFDIKNDIIACISISGPTSRFTEENKEEWKKIIINTAQEASNYLKELK